MDKWKSEEMQRERRSGMLAAVVLAQKEGQKVKPQFRWVADRIVTAIKRAARKGE